MEIAKIKEKIRVLSERYGEVDESLEKEVENIIEPILLGWLECIGQAEPDHVCSRCGNLMRHGMIWCSICGGRKLDKEPDMRHLTGLQLIKQEIERGGNHCFRMLKRRVSKETEERLELKTSDERNFAERVLNKMLYLRFGRS